MNHQLKYLPFIIFLFISCDQSSVVELKLNHSSLVAELLGEGVISTPLYERDIAISPDGEEIIFTLGNYKQTKRSLVSLKRTNGVWGSKTILAFSGKHQDIEPFFTPDGMHLYFASDRPIYGDHNRNDYNIWVVDKVESGWSKPSPLSEIINTEGNEFYPAVTNGGNLYFTATREDGIGREDIYRSEMVDGEFQVPLPLDTNINSPTFEFNAYISPDEDLIIFSSFGRSDGFGGGDLYISQKNEKGSWLPAKNMGDQINSDALDYCPFVDFANNNFYFTSEIAQIAPDTIKTVHELEKLSNSILNGMGNIYRIQLNEVLK